MSVHLLAQEFVQPVGSLHRTSGLVQVRFFTDAVNTSLFAFIVQLFGSLGQNVLDERPFDDLRPLLVIRTDP